jgi:hypothetical protein
MSDLGPDGWELRHGDLVVKLDRHSMLRGVERAGQAYSLAYGPRPAKAEFSLPVLQWKIREDGWVQCEYRFSAHGPQDVVGVIFDYPEAKVRSKRWLGDGPFRVWQNRRRGVTFGVWENDYNDTITGYRGWKYPEFKGCFANVRWLELETTEGRITIVPEHIPFVQVLTPRQPPDKLVAQTRVNLPECGLGFLHAIPPIGTKFKPAAAGGPQGQLTGATGEYSGVIHFFFGKEPGQKSYGRPPDQW